MGTAETIQVEGEIQKQLDLEVRDMVSALTQRVSELQRTTNNMTKSGSTQTNAEGKEVDDDNAGGPRVITLAGSNTGATMRTGKGEMSDQPYSLRWGEVEEEEEEMSTYVNSNFQSINNSLIFGGSYNSNDPGVHMEIMNDIYK
ncbi:uncharacterized protein LOC122672492 [Telopea speciosissima]|uniref:uncharacterized protein LOC122672492 n=1 Tax=Telopea speciosissima TaxID=54955 RepID=UPI001CC793FE|nr:uncharacterized protein LOC122672492 [Telopea speciosissima]